jgi:hypothetical protein
VTFCVGGIDVEKSPEVGAQNALRATVAINGSDYGPFTGNFSGWPFLQTTGTNAWATNADYAAWAGNATNANNAALLGGRSEVTISNAFDVAWTAKDTSLSNAVWGTFWTLAQQTTFSNWTAATYLPLHGTADNSAALGGLTVAGVSNAIIAAGDVRYDVAGAAVNASNGVLAHVFAGVGTTGTVTAAAGTATDYLARNGSWTALPSSAGFVVTNLDTTSANVTFTLPAPGTSFYVLSKTNSANWLYVVYGTTTSSVAGTASVKAYPDVILSLWRVEY